MTSRRLRDLLELMPEADELRAMRSWLVRVSRPDPSRVWAASASLGTVGDRSVDPADLRAHLEEIVEAERAHLEALNGHVLDALVHASELRHAEAAGSLLDAAALEADRERHEAALAYAEAAHAQATRHPDPGIAALTLRRQGRALRGLGRVEESVERYALAFDMAAALGDIQARAEAAIGAGNALEQVGRWAEAGRWYGRALEALGGLPSDQDPVLPEHWHVATTLHIVHRSLGHLEESDPWLLHAESLWARIPGAEGAYFLENARGQLAMAREDPETARTWFERSAAGAPAGYASVVVRLNLAECLASSRRVLDATEEARSAEAEAIALGVERALPHVYRTLGRCTAAAGNPEAFVLFERALEGGAALSPLERAMTLQAYAEAEATLGRLDTALDLLGQAAEGYAALGVRHLRRRWVDCFDLADLEPGALSSHLDSFTPRRPFP